MKIALEIEKSKRDKMKITTCATCDRKFQAEADYLRKTSCWRICDRKSLWFECSCGSCGSCNVLLEGEYEWFSQESQMSGDSASVFKKLLTLQPFPAVSGSAMQLQKALDDEHADSKKIESEIFKVPELAVSIIQMANDLKSAESNKIENLAHAISFTGLSRLKQLVTVFSSRLGKSYCPEFDCDKYWRRSLLSGKIAVVIRDRYAQQVGRDDAYLAGALTNIGKVIQALYFPEKLTSLIGTLSSPKNKNSWLEVETSIGMIDHSILGEVAASIWGFPVQLIDVVSMHHYHPDEVKNRVLPTDSIKDIVRKAKEAKDKRPISILDIAPFANQLTHWIMLETSELYEPHLRAYGARFGLNKADIDKFAEELCKMNLMSSQADQLVPNG